MAANGSLDLTMDSTESPEAWATTLQLTIGRHKIDQHRVLGETLGMEPKNQSFEDRKNISHHSTILRKAGVCDKRGDSGNLL